MVVNIMNRSIEINNEVTSLYYAMYRKPLDEVHILAYLAAYDKKRDLKHVFANMSSEQINYELLTVLKLEKEFVEEVLS